ncbi:MAG TPA: hypothetical protein VL860_04050, partial [Planctomycetota bacterium]|nr:hypothetical protein [Planctomycetota bacterium]
LIHADLAQMPIYLKQPEKQPEYRAGRSHEDFVTNLRTVAPKVEVHALLDAMAARWVAMLAPQVAKLAEGGTIEMRAAMVTAEERAAAMALAKSKYLTDEWTYRL